MTRFNRAILNVGSWFNDDYQPRDSEGTKIGNPAVPGDKLADGKTIHTWDGPDDKDNPLNWSPFDNSIWATVSWNMGSAFWPLIFVPMTETTGRLPGYFGAYIIFTISMFGTAFAQNFATIVVTRFFGGGGSSVAINIVGGSIADIWRGDAARSLPMSIFGFTSVAGIALGPFVGSVILQIRKTNPWRWIFYINIIYNAALIPIFWFVLKETRGDVILAKRAKKLRKKTGEKVFAESELEKPSMVTLVGLSFWRPVKMLLTKPVVSFFTLWVSFARGTLFLFFSFVVKPFQTSYGFDTLQTGLIQLTISVGALIATAINPCQDSLYLKSTTRNKERPGKPIPEARLYMAVPGGFIFFIGLFWYGWSCRPSAHWIEPTIAIAVAGIGIYHIYLGVVNYLTDAFEKYAASALSAASLGRNTFGAFLPLASEPLFTDLGFDWASSLLEFLGAALGIIPIVLLIKGPSIRASSPSMREAGYDDDEECVEYRKSTFHCVEKYEEKQLTYLVRRVWLTLEGTSFSNDIQGADLLDMNKWIRVELVASLLY